VSRGGEVATGSAAVGAMVRRGRIVTYGALLAVALVAFTGQEAWPLSSFSLFSEIRTGQSISWELVSVDGAGREHPVPLGRDLEVSRGATHLMPGFHARSRREQQARAEAWLRGSGVALSTVRAVRIYRVVHQVSTDGRAPGRVVLENLSAAVALGPS